MNRPWSKRRRYSRAASYIALATAGGLAIAFRPLSLQQTVSPVYVVFYLWAGLLIAGGLLAGIGAIRGRWAGEYIGLWPLMVSILAFAFAAATNGRGWSSSAGAFFLFSYAVWLYTRWLEVALLRREAADGKREQTTVAAEAAQRGRVARARKRLGFRDGTPEGPE